MTGTDPDDNKQSSTDEHKIKELEQEKFLLEEINSELDKKAKKVESKNSELKKRHSTENNEFNKKRKNQKNLQLNKKYIIPIITACLLLLGISVLYLNQQPKRTELTSEYLIENIKGEKVETWTSWNWIQGDTFHITVLSSPEVTPTRLKVIEDVIFSNETVTVGDAKYYKGWQGALMDVSRQEHKLVIPLHFDVNEANSGSGNIIIKLSPLENADGYTGYTKSIADTENHQILKAETTIYDVNKISNDELAIILRHELGHGFGLGHSDYENDLMFANVQAFPPYGYISECDVEAMAGLYDGNQKSQVTCTK